MKKRFARIIAVMLCAVTILVMTPVAVLASEGYTYNYDWWGDVQYSPDAYSVVGVYTLSSFGLNEKLNKPQGLFVSGDSFQFVRNGFFCVDGRDGQPIDSERLVFNRIVSLKSSFKLS